MHAAHTCTQRTHARSAHMHAHTRIKCDPSGACIRTLRRCGLTSRGAKRTVRYEKEKAMREDAPSVHPFKPHFVRSLARSATLTLRSPAAGSLRSKKKKKTQCNAMTQPRAGGPCDHITNRAIDPNPLPPSPCACRWLA